MEGAGSFRGDASLRTWLTAILINRVREMWRMPVLANIDASPDLMLDPRTIDELQRVDPIDLARALGEMPHGYREVVVLHDIEGFTHEEIGATLGVAPGTSKSQLARGRRWLRQALLKPSDPT
jgi:RNA polymerase sigma-70 factor (ECF subfamily)